jgi:hypothetical protein
MPTGMLCESKSSWLANLVPTKGLTSLWEILLKIMATDQRSGRLSFPMALI